MPTGVPVHMLCDPPPVLAHAVPVDAAPGLVVQAQAVQSRVMQARAVQARAAQEQVVVLQAVPGGWLETIASYDLNQPFPLRIGAIAGDYYPGLIPAAMADKTVLSMKVKTATGDVRVMHSVPHTLVAVGCFSGEQALKWATEKSKEYMDRANDVAQTGEKPTNYVGINMLVELDSRQEIKVSTGARGKVFQNFLILLCFYFVPNINWH